MFHRHPTQAMTFLADMDTGREAVQSQPYTPLNAPRTKFSLHFAGLASHLPEFPEKKSLDIFVMLPEMAVINI